MSNDETPKRFILDPMGSVERNTRCGYCPYCSAAMSMRDYPTSRCVVCWHTVRWDIENKDASD